METGIDVTAITITTTTTAATPTRRGTEVEPDVVVGRVGLEDREEEGARGTGLVGLGVVEGEVERLGGIPVVVRVQVKDKGIVPHGIGSLGHARPLGTLSQRDLSVGLARDDGRG